METKTFDFTYISTQYAELPPAYQELVDRAKAATDGSYAPYSGFRVGAAVRLKNGRILSASNQENASYPEGICAERNVMFFAKANFPDVPVTSLAIAACNADGYVRRPPMPCGACRQVIFEAVGRDHIDFNVILYGTDETLIIPQASFLLPLAFQLE